MTDMKRTIVESYLQQQLMQAGKNEDNDITKDIEPLDDASLLEFKQNVRMWMETDNYVKKLQGALKEKSIQKKILTEKILNYMTRFNDQSIDLNTTNGVLRYKISYVYKEPISQSIIKRKVSEYFSTTKSSDELMQKVFESREKTPKPTLRRVNVREKQITVA
jgi:hypothetical protein